MDDAVPTGWQNFVEVITHPFTLLQSLVEYTMAWFFTRPWGAFLPFAPALLVLMGVGSLVSYGWFLSRETLVERYSLLAEEAIASTKTGDEPKPTAGQPEAGGSGAADKGVGETGEDGGDGADAKNAVMELENITPYAELLLRRLLSLEKFNTRANYLVAAQMGLRGRVGQARYMMRQIAPTDAKGFPAAHAWLGVDRLQRLGITNDVARDELLHDLEIAQTWSGTGSSLLAAYARLLEKVGRVSDALAVMSEAANMNPDLQVELANMAYRNNRKKPLEQASADAKKRLESRIEEGTAGVADYAGLANLLLLDQETDKVLEVAARGLRLEPENAPLKRLISEAYRMKYVLSRQEEVTGTRVNLGLLDAALKADPSNPAVSQEVAGLVAAGQQAPPELQQALEEQLLQGQATALTHLLVAIGDLKEDKLEPAIVHLELALRQANNAPVVLNNLALALARTRPEQLPRCLELIDRAVSISPNGAEYRDSQGEIRELAGDINGAIESYEAAIGRDPTRIDTRKKLAAAYREVGLVDLADAQLNKAKQLESKP